MSTHFKSSSDLESAPSRATTLITGMPTLAPVTSRVGPRHVRTQSGTRRLERIPSIQLPEPVAPRVRLPGEFRTLSLHVTETHTEAQATHKRAKKSKDIDDIANLEWHSLSKEEVAQRLGVSPAAGLDLEIAARRLSKDGKNVITPPRTNWFSKIFWYFFGGFGSLLTVAAVLCFIAWKPLGNPNPQASNLALGVVLLIVVVLQAGFNAAQDFSTSRTMSSISSVLPTDVHVRRDGKVIEVPAEQLVMGDVVLVKAGDKVAADMRLVEVSSDAKFDRSILTGESLPVAASENMTEVNYMETRNIALAGTLCTEGTCVGVVVGRGNDTIFGRIAKAAGGPRPVRSTLQVEITRFVCIIGGLAAAVVIILVIAWAAWLRRDHPGFISTPTLIIDCVSVAVAFIPEGLPFCVTMSLSVMARQMKRKGVLCKALTTVESLGAVNVLASDKTGTLTQNKMSAVNIAIGSSSFTVTEARRGDTNARAAIEQLVAIAGICNEAHFAETEPDMPPETRKVNGDATDTGLLRFAESVSSVSRLRGSVVEEDKLSFNSKNKFAVKLVAPVSPDKPFASVFGEGESLVLLAKGAPDILMRSCTSILMPDGSVRAFDDSAKEQLVALQSSFASRGQRVLLFAKRSVSRKEHSERVGTGEEKLVALVSQLTVVGLIALVDPPKHDSRETVETCRRAGIRFFMVTGDFALTAAAIAREIGIITSPSHAVKHYDDLANGSSHDLEKKSVTGEDASEESTPREYTSLVLSGPDMLKLTDEQWLKVLKFDEIVFARTTPQQKLQIVRRFQDAGCTVAVTGDGVNDSPALKAADVGVAVAGGSEVAMEAADLILLDDFSAIVTGIESGRRCYENLKAACLYLLPAGSWSELMPVIVNVFFGVPQPLSNIAMILICAVTDVLPALSLIYEKPEADLLLQPPRDRKKDRLVDWRLLLQAYGFLGLIESLTSMVGAFYFGFHRHGIPFSKLWLKFGNYDVDPVLLAEATNRAQSIYFFNLVIMQWFNLLATRTRRLSIFQQDPIFNPRTRNLRLFPAMLIALCLAVFFSYVPFFQKTFLTRGVAAEFYFLPMAYGIGLLSLDELRKWSARRWPKGLTARMAW
ncbi:hypothetical protein JCM10908_004936 [Rhodotorula pacifica]|uniref:cation-translocating P-type ATPase n=1 Tax=Rhodotorula pacifica TaxID=1495444 RepID=UPI0031722808